MTEKTVVILLSDKRSGSTLFEREVCRHPAVSHVSYTPHTYNETHYWLKAACLLSMPKQLFHGSKPCKGYGSKADIRRSIVDVVRGNIPYYAAPIDDEELVYSGWNALCEEYTSPVFFEKSPQHPHHWAALELMLKWREQTEYKVLFIGLVRNPMAVMYSAEKLFRTDPSERQFSWANANRNILLMKELVGEANFLSLRYEELIESSSQCFETVCHFVGIKYEETMGSTTHRYSKNKWRQDPMFDLSLDTSVARLAYHLGYSEEDIFNPPKSPLSVSQNIKRSFQYFSTRLRSKLINKLKLLKNRLGVTR